VVASVLGALLAAVAAPALAWDEPMKTGIRLR